VEGGIGLIAAAKHKASRGSQHFRAKATNRVNDLQGMVSELQQARRENRVKDIALLEEQMHQMLREWKAELREAFPASSLLVCPFLCIHSFSCCMPLTYLKV
jgi:hypothetical protein